MPDYRIFDAINLFKHSSTGRGTASLEGGRAYQDKYRSLVNDVQRKLWSLWNVNDIGFHPLGTRIGASRPRHHEHDIKVNDLVMPSNDPASYQSADNQSKLAATSCTIAHEAVHLALWRDMHAYPEDEVLCRTIEALYFRELTSPCSYTSRFANAQCTAQYLPSTMGYYDYQGSLNHLHDLIDVVLDEPEYRSDLESDKTAEFLSGGIGWWGGLSRRWPSTRGYFLRSLASREGRDFAYSILEVLESLTPQQWSIAKTVAGDLQKIRRGLAAGSHLLDNAFALRLVRVQEVLREDFGIRAR